MKNVLLIVAFLFCVTGMMAQTEKGKFRLGGNVDLSFLDTDFDSHDYTTSKFNVEVNGGYFVMDNLSIEVGLGYNREKEDDADNALSILGAEIGARYYLPVKIFFGASLDVVSIDNVESATGTGINLKAGYAWFIKDNIALEPAVGYRFGLSSKDDGTIFNQFGVKLGLSVYF